jgi:EAL domain-containing protein (putative c-di-GMP-specific phosphodiesterase class I)
MDRDVLSMKAMHPTLKMSEASVKSILDELDADALALEATGVQTMDADLSGLRPLPPAECALTKPPPGVHQDVLDHALASLRIELDPIFDVDLLTVLGHEARAIWADPSFGAQTNVQINRCVRHLAATAISAKQRGLLFIDIFHVDLLDPELYRPDSPLAREPERVVLQLRGPTDLSAADLRARLSVLRFLGFKLAVADIDAAASRLSLLAELTPEYVKLDATITRGIGASVPKQRMTAGLVKMCSLLDATPIAEGVVALEDRAALARAGCTLVQGRVDPGERALFAPRERGPAIPPTTMTRRREPAISQATLKRVAAR